MENIKREMYLKRIRPFYDTALIKVLVGQRRVGKSFLLMQIMEEIKQRNKQANIIYIDKEKYEFNSIKDDRTLISYFEKKYRKEVANYLFIDEVQEIASFEKALRSLLNEAKADIYCTGSNAHIFSAELATLLSGRFIQIKIHPLSYPEFLTFHDLKNSQQSLDYFLKLGGLPFLIHLPKEQSVIYEYLKNIIATIIFKDVVNRHQIRDTMFLDNLLTFVADNIGNLFSARKITDFLKSLHIQKSVGSVINYIKYLEEANIIFKVRRMNVQGKKIFDVGEKYYFEDIGIRNAIIGFRPQDINKIIENLIFNHLVFCDYSVYVGKLGTKEIDFVAQKENEKLYVQAAYQLSDTQTVQREFGNLDLIADHYPKYVVSMDPMPINTSYKGIKHIHLREFLSRCF